MFRFCSYLNASFRGDFAFKIRDSNNRFSGRDMLSITYDRLSIYGRFSVSAISRRSILKPIANRFPCLAPGGSDSLFSRPPCRSLETLAGPAMFNLVYADDRRKALFARK